MRICGIDYSGSDLIPVVLERRDGKWHFVPTEPKKLTLSDIYDTGAVRKFALSVGAYMQDNRVDRIVVKKRAQKGLYAGGAASFRMGAVVQICTKCEVHFLAPRTISTAVKDLSHPDASEPLKYQLPAFEVAWAGSLVAHD